MLMCETYKSTTPFLPNHGERRKSGWKCGKNHHHHIKTLKMTCSHSSQAAGEKPLALNLQDEGNHEKTCVLEPSMMETSSHSSWACEKVL